MLTRKENLLVRPFQDKRFIEHRFKVEKALPRIDQKCPPERNHVLFKCKKLQYEVERHAQIEKDNFILLQHLASIMSKKRIDNIWLSEHPKFLQKIKLYKINERIPTQKIPPGPLRPDSGAKTRKDKCIACNPHRHKSNDRIPEERIPWETKQERKFSFVPPPSLPTYAKNPEVKISTVQPRRQNKMFPIVPSPGINKSENTGRTSTADSLTVVIKFPTITQVTLDTKLCEEKETRKASKLLHIST